MKILIGTYVLTEGARDSDEEPETVATQTGQVAALFRAADASVFPRGGRVFSFTFSKTREHDSFQAAEDFRLLHATEIPTTGVLTFITEGVGGSEGAIYFAQHNVDQVRIRQTGCATISTYQLTASQPTKTRPVASSG